jgi:methyl-accepting chemotaxis protein
MKAREPEGRKGCHQGRWGLPGGFRALIGFGGSVSNQLKPVKATSNMLQGRSLSIAARIVGSFGFVIAILAGQSATSFLIAGHSRELLRTTVTEARARENVAVALQSAMLQQQLHMREMGVLIDINELRTLADQIRALDTQIESDIQQLRQAKPAQGEIELIENIARTFAATATARQEFEQQSLTMQTDQANALYAEKLQAAGAQQLAWAAKLAQEQARNAELAFGQIADLSDRMRVVTILSAAIGIVAAAAAGWLLHRSIIRALQAVIDVSNRIAGGDLTISIDAGEDTEVGKMLSALQRMSERMKSIFVAMQESSASILAAVSEIAAGNMHLSSRTSEQAASLEAVARSVKELSEALHDNATAASDAGKIANDASNVAGQGGSHLAEMGEVIQVISTCSTRIDEFVGLIEGVAIQTNILAINAAIEAASAGDSGKGFAVVANEIRSLAQRSAETAKDIARLIEENRNAVQKGIAIAQQAQGVMQQIIHSSEHASGVVASIAQSAGKQTENVVRVDRSVISIDDGLQQNAALVEESAAATQSLMAQVESLNTEMYRFKVVPTVEETIAESTS